MEVVFKRPVVSFCILMIIGIITAALLDSYIVVGGVAALMSASAFALGFFQKEKRFVAAGMLLFFLAGGLEFMIMDHLQQERFEAFGNQEVIIAGTVVSAPEVKGEKVSVLIRIESIRPHNGEHPVRTGGNLLLSTQASIESGYFEYGQRLEFEGLLTLPKGVRNPGGFNYRRYLAQKGAGASVFAFPYNISSTGGTEGFFLMKAGLAIRNRIIDVMEQSLPHQQAALMNGMLIGSSDGLSDAVQDAFSAAGLTHIMVVSGANIAFMLLPITFLLKKLRVRRIPANLLMIAFLILFLFIAGFEPSVLRAVLMAVILLLAGILYREVDIYASIALSCILLLIISPYILFNIGFQLSYAATLSIVMLYRNIEKLVKRRFVPGWVAATLAATISAQLGVLPILLICFNKVSLIALVSNLLAVPLLELITILGMVMAVLGQISLTLSQVIGYLNTILLSAVLYIVKVTSGVPFAMLRTATPPFAAAAAYYAAVWYLLWYRPLKGIRLGLRHAAAFGSVIAVVMLASFIKPQIMEVVFLDVGQGDSAFIRTYSGKTLLIDGGGSDNPEKSSNVGETVVLPFLLDCGVTQLDAVIATHPHGDHIQGLQQVLEEIAVKQLMIPSIEDDSGFVQLLKAASADHTQITRCSTGQRIRLDDRTTLQVLHPTRNSPISDGNANNISLVLKLTYGLTDILFTGDAERETEEELLSEGVQLDAEVIKLGHHGSETSSTKAFLEAVSPEAAVISVGKNNYGHPSPLTIQTLKQLGISVFRMDECGALVLKSDGHTVRMKVTVPEKERAAS